MSGLPRSAAVDRLTTIVETVEADELPVPVTEVWAYGAVALGLDPVERLDVYVTKDVLLRDEASDRTEALEARFGVRGIGRTVRADWAEANPGAVRANDAGHADPARCLAAHLLPEAEPTHLEVCNTGFQDNVTQRLRGAIATEQYDRAIDPRAVCLWAGGQRSSTALPKLRAGDFVFPPLTTALEMIGADPTDAERVATALQTARSEQIGRSVRSDVV